MNRLKAFWFRLRKTHKYGASNPENFEEIWSFNANGIQLGSLLMLIFSVVGILFTLFILKGPFSTYFSKNDVSIERKKLENQYKEIQNLTNRINQQDAYILSVKTIISGDIIQDTLADNVPETKEISTTDLNSELSENQKLLIEKVRDDTRTKKKAKKKVKETYFVEPVKGHVSQQFDVLNHPGVDIVTEKDRNIVACLAGTVIYTGYSQKDGYFMIINHANGFTSIYKHAKTLLKKIGAKVQLNDAIAIVGNTGENSTGPHLHFELWLYQNVVNPMDYMHFEK
jgi:murein DD-endopeptidase MepM/ murein hydrolase activator NlpD